MRSVFILFLLFSLSLNFLPSRVAAIYDPLSVPNNRYGIHILDVDEAADAATLVNSSGGDWGYVTIPIRIDDRDHDKWLRFFVTARQKHLIPIVRLSTYSTGDTWTAPTSYDLVDFANFLNDLPWPVKNRYIILFNEPNHANEWGGRVSPQEYASLILDARLIFKTRSEDFFLLSAGLDMSSPNSDTSMDALEFYRQMSVSQPDWYSAVDGVSVHTYPNPSFRASPYSGTRFGITSYRYEANLLNRLGYPLKPIFITETGSLADTDFFTPAFTRVWTESNIIAVTPFVLFAGAGDFIGFSLLDPSHQPKVSYKTLYNLPKVRGSPLLSIYSSPISNTPAVPPDGNHPVSTKYNSPGLVTRFISLFKRQTPLLVVGDTTVSVEISDTDATRERGLSGRNSLSDIEGMLFVFPQSDQHTFWMKDMKFSLDFIWINNGTVVGLNSGILPPALTQGQPQIIRPDQPVNQVLEVNSGFIAKNNIRLGDRVYLE